MGGHRHGRCSALGRLIVAQVGLPDPLKRLAATIRAATDVEEIVEPSDVESILAPRIAAFEIRALVRRAAGEG